MPGKPKTSRKKVVIIVIATVLFAPVMLSSTVRRAVTTKGPLKGPYLRYSKWRYNWRAPSDLGDGRNATKIVI